MELQVYCCITGLGFSQSKSDYSLFTKKTNDSFIALLIYVDDILVASIDLSTVQFVKASLSDKFKLKDLGHVKYFLGIEIVRSKKCIFLCQRKYVLEIIFYVSLLDCKLVHFPMDPHSKVSKNTSELLDDATTYKRLIERLLYLPNSRPDITYPVHYLSQFLDSPRNPHMQDAIKILKYVKMTQGQCIFLQPLQPYT